jgi:hypothetical protein
MHSIVECYIKASVLMICPGTHSAIHAMTLCDVYRVVG